MPENQKGHCKHGEFELMKGCEKCMAERQSNYSPVTTDMPHAAVEQAFTPPDTTAVVKVNPQGDQAVLALHAEAVKLQRYAEVRTIVSIDDAQSATNDLSIIAKLKKAIEEKRKEYVGPINEHLKTVNDAFKVLTEPLNQADTITRKKVMDYRQEQDRIRQEQERINKLKAEAALAELALTGKVEEPVEPVEVIDAQPKQYHAELGTTGTMDVWKWKVENFALIPDSYKTTNDSVLNAAVKSSKGKVQIPGILIYNEPVLRVKAK